MNSIVLFQFLLFSLKMFDNSVINCQKESYKMLEKLLPNDYNRYLSPEVNGSAVEVSVSIAILSVYPEKDVKMAFNVDLFLHLYWTDPRLQAIKEMSENITLDHEWKSRLWVPDAYIRNTISGGVANDVLAPSYYFVISNVTQVFMAARLRLKVSCNMKFHKYPFDKQLCFMNITTLSQRLNSVRLIWKSFKVGSHVQLPEFVILEESKGTCSKIYESLGSFPCLYVAIHFKRNVGNYLIKRFIPSFLIVSMSFIGFWIPTSIAPARVSLIITALLTLITQQIQSELEVSYIYALQVWTIVCIVFVFATLLEYAIAISWPFCQSDQSSDDSEEQKKTQCLYLRATSRNCVIDIISRILFPISFLLFVILFVVIYSNIN